MNTNIMTPHQTTPFTEKESPSRTVFATSDRIESIDLLRGIVMIIMAIDHVRDYFHFDSFLYDPVDIEHSNGGLFITRWITHLCAPTFIFIAGTSAYFVTQRKSAKNASYFLFTRGLWLVILQFTIIRFGWNFDPLFHYNSNTIISVIGFCMIALSLFIHLRPRIILIIGLGLVTGHNLLDNISFQNETAADVMWSFLHVPKTYDLGNGYLFTFLYPVLPWIGVMALGYCFGRLYHSDYSPMKRKNILLCLAVWCLFGFVVLRNGNIYGDPVPWSKYPHIATTLMSFFNLQKYPPSLLFLLATLGISLLLLAAMEGKDLSRWKSITLFGNVALFYYVLHIFLIHLLALLAAVLTGHPWYAMIFTGPITKGSSWLNGSYGFELWTVYLVWILVVMLLYPLCAYWSSFKKTHKHKWWISYV